MCHRAFVDPHQNRYDTGFLGKPRTWRLLKGRHDQAHICNWWGGQLDRQGVDECVDRDVVGGQGVAGADAEA